LRSRVADAHGGQARRFADAVIVAAGASVRMGGADKLGAHLDDRTVLEWSLDAMRAATAVDRVVVVARAEKIDELRRLDALRDVELVLGGEERSDSVRNGVQATTADVVLVHDAARPLASPGLADAVAAAAAEHGAAVPAVPVVDSLKRWDGSVVTGSVERAGLIRTQTPQGARRAVLVEALAATVGQSFTDEAALLESRGVAVATVPGEATNIKLTEPADLDFARTIVRGRRGDRGSETRLGFGQDSHGFGPDDGLWLGGMLIDQAPRLYGHSDGDVALHAIATALLSAAGLGDLGRLFPAGEARTRGIASSELLAEAVGQVVDSGWAVESAHVSIVGARPRLGGARLELMRERVAAILGAELESVSVTASTGNLSGPEGAGRAISATALVAVHRR
jgi:2-C-methyl-D-erythritol 4-phosphate cytidylyltransferase/2-C-methyl-D-erythritol 2,4-cyclodiphosphate synthase